MTQNCENSPETQMRAFVNCNPEKNDEFTHQTAVSEISDEEFVNYVKSKQYTWYQFLYQAICFIVFLGPIRVALAGVTVLVFVSSINVIRFILKCYGADPQVGKGFIYNYARIGLRITLFCCGIVWVQSSGKIDPDARFFLANHTAIIDPFVMLIQKSLTPVVKYEVSQVPFLRCVDNQDPVYVKRDQPYGATKQIIERANNPKCSPVVAFPEGTCGGGKYLLKFHRGCFLTEYKVQLVAIRYWTPLMPQGWSDFAWKKNFGALQHFWNLLSMPFTFITIDYLPAISKKNEGKGDIDAFATKAQLLLANHLHLQAINKSSHQIFRKQDKDADNKEKAE